MTGGDGPKEVAGVVYLLTLNLAATAMGSWCPGAPAPYPRPTAGLI